MAQKIASICRLQLPFLGLLLSCNRICALLPLQVETLKVLNADDLDKIDAFRVLYCDLQDTLGNKTFRSLLKLEEEQLQSNLDMLNKIEKRGILGSFEEWKKLREIRNLFAHDYAETDEEKIEALRGNCKTTVPQKIDDFAANSQGQLAGPSCADENMPEWTGEEAWREVASKGRFYGAHEFCNCLLNLAYSNSVKLIAVVDNITDYAKGHFDFSMDQFPFLMRSEEAK